MNTKHNPSNENELRQQKEIDINVQVIYVKNTLIQVGRATLDLGMFM